jgi:uncharacterized protein (TIGR02099 family)
VLRRHHFHFAWHLTVRAYRLATWLVLIAGLAITLLLLGVRYWLLPSIDSYRPWIESVVSRAAQQRVTIARVSGNWSEVRPRLALEGVVIHDAEGRPALELRRVDAVLAWRSLLRASLRFHTLVVSEPDLTVRRDAQGRLFVAGIAVDDTRAEGGGFTDWLLAQPEIQLVRARVTWVDEQRGARPFELANLDLRLQSALRRHRLGVSALLPPEVGGRVELRGDLRRRRRPGLGAWSGQLYGRTTYVNVASLQTWLDLPVAFDSGSAEVEAWVEVEEGAPTDVTADLRVAGLQVRLAPDLPRLDFAQAQGRVTFDRIADGVEASVRRFGFVLASGVALPPTDVLVRRTTPRSGQPAATQVEAISLAVAPLVALAEGLPLDPGIKNRLRGVQASGNVDDLRLEWTGALPRPERYSVTARLNGVTLFAGPDAPGLANLSGHVRADQDGGRADIAGKPLALVLPRLFEEPLRFDAADAQVSWRFPEGRLAVEIARLSFSNPDLAGSVAGSYQVAEAGPGVANLTGSLSRVQAASAHRYVPIVAGTGTRAWLEAALAEGTATDVRFTLRGDLRQFPFDRAPRSGLFEVVSRIDGVRLQYAPNWPAVEGASGTMTFRGRGMEIVGRARVLGVEILKARAIIPDLLDPEAVLEVDGDAQGPTAGFLRFLDASPVGEMIGGFTRGLRVEGAGKLGLQLRIPLHHVRDTGVTGNFRFLGNQLSGHPDIPPMRNLDATLRFTHKGVEVTNASAVVFEGPATFNVSVDQRGGVRVSASGRVTPTGLRKMYDTPWLGFLEGETDWKAVATVRKQRFDLTVESSLAGLALKLPAPLAKPAPQAWPLRVQRRSGPGGESLLQVGLGRILSAAMALDASDGQTRITRGAVDFGPNAKLPPGPGVRVSGNIDGLDVDEWLDVVQAMRDEGRGTAGAAEPETTGSFDFAGGTLDIQTLEAFGRTLHAVRLSVEHKEGVWGGRVSSREVEGDIDWIPAGRGRLVARLSRLHVPEAETGPAGEARESITGRDLPALDVTATSFRFGKLDLGALALKATPNGPAWQVEKLELDSPEGRLKVQGGWQLVRGRPSNQFAVRLDVQNIGGLMKRLGQPEGIVGGTARFEGPLAWEGLPYRVDVPTLSGRVHLKARKGRFSKLEPGIGKLLGVFSLQSLPRRLSFDFRDIFAQGFSFDEIDATAQIERGTMRLEDFLMTGTAARVQMKGELDLVKETQALELRVVPSISDTVAIGTALVNPAIGLATLLAGRALNNPIDQVVAVDYRISGPWDDPQVTRVGRAAERPKGQGGK